MTPTLIPIILFGGAFVVAALAILAKTFAHVVCHWRDVSLKMRMVDAGYSAEEIERTIAARRGGATTDFDVPPAKKPPRRMVS